jgi:hypothetical protein
MSIFDEESEEDSTSRFDHETAEVDSALEPEGEVIPPPHGDDSAEDDFPLETLVTAEVCGLLFSIPGAIRARQTGHEFWLLDEEEKKLIGGASQPLMVYLVRKYLGEGVGMFAATAVALTAIYAPRQLREVQESRREKRNPGNTSRESARPAQPPPTSRAASPPSSASEDAGSQSSSGDWGIPFKE